MKTRLTLTCLTLMLWLPGLLLAGQEGSHQTSRATIPWQSYHAALASAKADSKPVLLHFTTNWCKGGKAMKRETYGNPKVARYLQENFACGWVDTEKQTGLAKKYKVNGLPTLWFLDSRGKSLTSVDGFLGPEKMLLVLKFINTKAYESMSYEDWKENRPRP